MVVVEDEVLVDEDDELVELLLDEVLSHRTPPRATPPAIC